MQWQAVLMAHPVHLLLASDHQPSEAHHQQVIEMPDSTTHPKKQKGAN